jgi:RNA polymerase sigma-70 factor (ECF subfamily)
LVKIVVWNFFRNPTDLDDICQEVFLKVYQNLSNIKDPAKFKGWILKIAFRTCIDFSRKHQSTNNKRVALKIDENRCRDNRAQIPFEEIEARSLLIDLSPVDATIVWLKYVEKENYQTISEILNISTESARKKASRSMKYLRRRVKL